MLTTAAFYQGAIRFCYHHCSNSGRITARFASISRPLMDQFVQLSHPPPFLNFLFQFKTKDGIQLEKKEEQRKRPENGCSGDFSWRSSSFVLLMATHRSDGSHRSTTTGFQQKVEMSTDQRGGRRGTFRSPAADDLRRVEAARLWSCPSADGR